MITWYDLKPDTEYDDSIFTQDIGGVSYNFQTTYNDRAGLWMLTITDTLGNVLAAGPLEVNTDVFHIYRESERFPLPIFLVSIDDKNTECARDDLNQRCNLIVGVAA